MGWAQAGALIGGALVGGALVLIAARRRYPRRRRLRVHLTIEREGNGDNGND